MAGWLDDINEHNVALILIVGTFLFMVAASLRFDDALHIIPDTIIREEIKFGDLRYHCYRGKRIKAASKAIG